MGKKSCFVCKKAEGVKVTYHRFPTDPEQLKRWGRSLNIDIQELPRYAYLCSNHFKDGDVIQVGRRHYIAGRAIPKIVKPTIYEKSSLPSLIDDHFEIKEDKFEVKEESLEDVDNKPDIEEIKIEPCERELSNCEDYIDVPSYFYQNVPPEIKEEPAEEQTATVRASPVLVLTGSNDDSETLTASSRSSEISTSETESAEETMCINAFGRIDANMKNLTPSERTLLLPIPQCLKGYQFSDMYDVEKAKQIYKLSKDGHRKNIKKLKSLYQKNRRLQTKKHKMWSHLRTIEEQYNLRISIDNNFEENSVSDSDCDAQ